MATQSNKRPWLLVLDWDGTMTKYDTTSVIGNMCLDKARRLNADPESLAFKPWSVFSDAYMTDYSAWKKAQPLAETERKSIHDEVAYLSSSRPIEVASFDRVRNAVLASQAMQDFTSDPGRLSESMQAEGQREVKEPCANLIRDQTGLKDLLEAADQDGNSWSIISVSWSRSFIIGAARASDVLPAKSSSVEDKIWCNELLAPKQQTGSEGPDGLICSAQDKLETFHTVVARHTRAGVKPTSVYVGDSTTDLGCLAAADVGICMRDTSVNSEDDKLRQTLERLKIPCEHISRRREGVDTEQLYWTTNFEDIASNL